MSSSLTPSKSEHRERRSTYETYGTMQADCSCPCPRLSPPPTRSLSGMFPPLLSNGILSGSGSTNAGANVQVVLTPHVDWKAQGSKRPSSANGRSKGRAHCMQYITITNKQKGKQSGRLKTEGEFCSKRARLPRAVSSLGD